MSKILLTTTFFYPYISGLSLYPYRLAKLLVKAKHSVSVLTFRHQKKLPLKENLSRINIIRLVPHLRITKGLFSFTYPFHTYSQVAKHDLVVLNCPSLENIWPLLIAKVMKKRIIVLYHCDVDCQKDFLLKVASKVVNFVSYLCCLLSQKIICSTPSYARTSPILKPFKAKISYHYPLVEPIKPDNLYLNQLKRTYLESRPYIGFVGRFSREKNLETLLYALKKLQKHYPKLLFLCAGPFASQVVGEKKYYQKIQLLLEELQINFAVLGVLKDRQLAAFYRFIDILVLPSNNRTEAFGMVQIESILQQTPVVASNSPGIRQTIKETGYGKLFNPKSSSSLEKAIRLVLKNKSKLKFSVANYQKKLEKDSQALLNSLK
jgi:glycosyltransferase involved in cell wall biosynthesis